MRDHFTKREQTMSDELKITKDRVLAAAKSCSTAREVLTKLFPEAFKETWTPPKGYEEYGAFLAKHADGSIGIFLHNDLHQKGIDGRYSYGDRPSNVDNYVYGCGASQLLHFPKWIKTKDFTKDC